METYTELKSFCANLQYGTRRHECLRKLDIASIDPPIVDLVKGFSKLPCCFTLQSCWGHFLFGDLQDPHNTWRLAETGGSGPVRYRLAYIALCVENSRRGKTLLEELKKVPEIDPAYMQCGCADWFWKKQKNSYVLQVEPERFKTKDSITVDYAEALHLQKARDLFFARLNDLLLILNGK